MKNITVFTIKGTTLLLLVLLFASGCLTYNLRESYLRSKYGVAKGVFLKDISMGRKLEEEVTGLVEALCRESLIRPRNAYLDPLSGEVLPEQPGKKIDVQKTVELVMGSRPRTTVYPVIIDLDPEITADLLEGISQRKGSYATGFGNGGRGENIRIAALALHNYLLLPGEVFSFNRATGPRVAERGYKLAPIIVGGTIVPGYGGGVCQVSTTLYNAVLNSKLQVVQRFPHSRPVGYVPRGRDATVSEHLDFKFRNNTDGLILIKTSAYGYRLVVEIWG
ncbi:MAG TPA: VanW family protein [Firmicutes bacterium]|nr:VanW family protein [Bacillota bacterium]